MEQMEQITMDSMCPPELEAMVEAILFASGEPVSLERLAFATDTTQENCRMSVESLRDKYLYEQRGIRIVVMEDRYQMCSEARFAPMVRKALETRKPPSLTQTAIEVLSIIAYAQPTTKSYVEKIRGVDSAYTVNSLAEKGIIEECGRLDAPGRPALYCTTDNFLRIFGISSLEELPKLPETVLADAQSAAEETV